MKKIMQKLCMELLSLLLVLPLMGTIPTLVEGATGQDVSMVHYEDDFSGVQNERLELGTGASYANGGVSFQTEANSGQKLAFGVYLNQDKSFVGENFVIEYTLVRTNHSWGNSNIAVMLANASNRSVDIRWSYIVGAKPYASIGAYKTTGYTQVKTGVATSGTMKFKLYYNRAAGTCTLWINDIVIEEINNSSDFILSPDAINKINFYTEGPVKLTLEDFKYYSVPVEGIPAVDESIYEENFDGSTIDATHITTYPTRANYIQEKGALSITTTDTQNNQAPTDLFFQTDKSQITGNFLIETTVTGDASSRYRVFFIGNCGMYLEWYPAGDNLFMKADTGSGYNIDIIPNTTLSTYAAQSSLNIKVFFEVDGNKTKIKVWLNDQLAATKDLGVLFNVSQLQYLNYLGTIYVQDVYCYRKFTDDDKVKKDLESITLESILNETPFGEGLVTKNLNLYKTAPFGSTIQWSSSHENLIEADGTVHRPRNEDGNIYTTLTATVTQGDCSLDKEFRIGVIPESYLVSPMPLPEEDHLVFLSDFKTKRGEDGNILYNDSENIWHQIHGFNARGWNGRITEYDGYVEMMRNSNSKDGTNLTSYTYYLQPSTQNIEGIPTAQFSLKKTAGQGKINFTLGGSVGLVVNCFWNKDDTILIAYASSERLTTKAYKGEIDITVMSNSSTGKFSMWINGENLLYEVEPYSIGATGLSTVGLVVQDENFLTFELSNVRAFQAKPYDHMKPMKDADWLTEDLLRNGTPAPATGMLASDLYLPTTGQFNSSISWSSSDESLIATDGTITRPLEEPDESSVTLTATVSYRCFKVIKQFIFDVMPLYGTDVSIAQKDRDYLTHENWNFFSFSDRAPNAVTTSLNLPSKGPYGSTYLWKTSNSSVITSSGRVTRGKWDGEPQTVTMTAEVIYGNAVETKEFTFTVLPDEEIKDPQHMSDEDFFGVWENGKWTNLGKFDYSANPGLSKVEAAVKDGNNYELAKIEFLEYMRSRPRSFLTSVPSRNTGYADGFNLTGVHSNNYVQQYQGMTTVRSHEYEQYDIKLASLSKSAVNGYKIGARYNENTEVRILSTEAADPNLRPKLHVTVNGAERAYEAVGDTVLRYGSNRYTNYVGEEEMEVRFFGEFQGEGTADVLLQFDLSDIEEIDTISNAYITITAKIVEPYAEEKELLLSLVGSEWKAESVSANSFVEYTCNFNGVPGKNHWYMVQNAEAEYHKQSTRFINQKYAVAEYVHTGDERYAYSVIWDWMDFIRDTQGVFDYDKEQNAGHLISMDWEKTREVIRYGAFPSALCVSQKLLSYTSVLDLLMNSQYMTPDACTAMIKNIWHGIYELRSFLEHPNLQDEGANQVIFEADSYIKGAMYMPEFSFSNEYINAGIQQIEGYVEASYFDDGAYIEATGGYSHSMLNLLLSFWQNIADYGYEFSERSKDLLDKAAIYNCLLNGPRGIGMAWGDSGKYSGSLTPLFPEYYDITHDEEFQFISTHGRKGIQPDWTSKLYESNMLASMRSDWTDDAMYVLMPSAGFGGHGHPDANSLNVVAFQRQLLIDPGWYNYDPLDPIHQYVKSTRAHNTVEVDGKTQNVITSDKKAELIPPTIKHNWVTNQEYDFYSVTFQGNDDVDHRRTVTFVKPNFLIVSDLMTPTDNKEHNYRQLWHMSAQADLQHDDETRTIYSNFPSGANIMLASADTDATIIEEMGYDTIAWGVASKARYGYYFKEKVKGKQTFDTVIMPYAKTGNVKADHIDLGVPTHDATGMKITTEISNEINDIYYMLDYDHINGAEHIFGAYKSDGELALARENENGGLEEAILNNGSYIRKEDGTIVLTSENTVDSISFEKIDTTIKIMASDDVLAEDIKLCVDTEVKNIIFNGTSLVFVQTDGIISLTNVEKEEEDNNGNQGGSEGGLDAVTRRSLLTAGSSDATLLDNLNLDVEGVEFESSEPAIIDPVTGVVTRPDFTKSVTLTAKAGEETKAFAFRVPGKEVAIGGTKAIPQSVSVIYENNFDGTTIDTSKISASTSITQDGALYLTRESGSSTEAFATVRPLGNDTSISGKFVIEASIDKYSVWGGAFFRTTLGVNLNSFSKGGGLVVADAAGNTSYAYDSFGMASGLLKITLAANTDNDTYDLWINNQYVQSGNLAADAVLSYVQFSTGQDSSYSGTHKVNNLSIYYTEMPAPGPAVLYSDDFEDGVLSGAIEKTTFSADTMETGGTLNISGKSTGGSGTGAIYLREDRLPVSGKFSVEFTIGRVGSSTTNRYDFVNSDGQTVFYVQFSVNKNVYIYNGSRTQIAAAQTYYETSMPLKVEVDTTAGTVSMWVASRKVSFSDGNDYANFGNALKNISKVSFTGWGGTVNMESFTCTDLAPESFSGVDMHYRDTFSNGTLDSKITVSNMIETGDALKTTNASGASSATIYLKDDRSEVTGNFTVEFFLTRSALTASTAIQFWGDGGRYVSMGWWTNSSGVTGAPTFNLDASTTLDALGAKNFLHVKAQFNTADKTVSIWLNGTKVAENGTQHTAGTNGVSHIAISNNAGADAAVAEFRYYSDKVASVAPEVSSMAIDYNAYDRKVNILSPAAEDVTVIAAAYAGSGNSKSLISVVPVEVTLVEDGSVVADTSALLTTGANSVDIYLWSDMEGLQPLCAGSTVTGSISAY